MKLSIAVALVLLVKNSQEGSPKFARIIKGHKASPHQFPYMAALVTYEKNKTFQVCGGAIISKQWILTAAHCILNKYHPYPIVAIVGTNDYTKGGIPYPTEYRVVHENHTEKGGIDNDIGLIKISTIMKFNKKVTTVRLPDKEPTDPNVLPVMELSGWGLTKEHTNDTLKESKELQYIDYSLYDRKRCKKAFKRLKDTQFCATHVRGKGACKGDSGSPLVVNGVVYGITSFTGPKCAKGPVVFTNVYRYLRWIKNIKKVFADDKVIPLP